MDDFPKRLKDSDAIILLKQIVGYEDVGICVQNVLERPDKYVFLLRRAGLSIRQVCRLTGISFGIVRKY